MKVDSYTISPMGQKAITFRCNKAELLIIRGMLTTALKTPETEELIQRMKNMKKELKDSILDRFKCAKPVKKKVRQSIYDLDSKIAEEVY
jgi:phage regulator Rha-like protein